MGEGKITYPTGGVIILVTKDKILIEDLVSKTRQRLSSVFPLLGLSQRSYNL